MITLGTDWRALIVASLVVAAMRLPPGNQDERYGERQVLDPETGEWVDEARPPEAAAADALDEARRYLAQDKPGKARKILKRWLKESRDDERYYEGVFLLGETHFESGDFWQALKQYDKVADNAAGELFRESNRRSVDAARAFLSGKKRIVWKILRLPAYDEGIEILDRVWERMPGTRLGELALKLKADFYFNQGDVDLAQDEYANLVEQYQSGRYVQLAMLRTAEAAEAAFPGIRFDDLPLIEAEERYRQVEAAFPGYAVRQRVRERLEGIRQTRAEKDLDIAQWYERTGQAGAARFYYETILQSWPETLASAEARMRLRAMGVETEETEGEESLP